MLSAIVFIACTAALMCRWHI